MRITSLKVAAVALVFMAIAMVPSASATTCPADACLDLTTTNLTGLTAPFGTVQLTQSGNNVNVTIQMNSGYAVLINGGDIGINTSSSLTLTGSSLSGFTSGVSASLKKNNVLGGFSFGYIFQTSGSGGQQFLSSLSFTIQNATVSQLTGFGIHLCVLDNTGGGCATTGFAVTSGTGVVPEPGTLGLLGTGLVGIAGLLRRRYLS